MPSSRYFFAVWPPQRTATALETWASGLEGRRLPADKLHLTLAFLGAAAPEKAVDAARKVRWRAHTLPIEQVRYWKHNRIVWAGPRDTPAELQDLAQALHLELFRAEYILERRPFSAHVTLVRNAPPPRTLPPLPALEWPVSAFTLVRSANSSDGSAYEVLEHFRL